VGGRILFTANNSEVQRYAVQQAGRPVPPNCSISVWQGAFIDPRAVKKQVFDPRRALDDDPRPKRRPA
jgi:hypothetical protein